VSPDERDSTDASTAVKAPQEDYETIFSVDKFLAGDSPLKCEDFSKRPIAGHPRAQPWIGENMLSQPTTQADENIQRVRKLFYRSKLRRNESDYATSIEDQKRDRC